MTYTDEQREIAHRKLDAWMDGRLEYDRGDDWIQVKDEYTPFSLSELVGNTTRIAPKAKEPVRVNVWMDDDGDICHSKAGSAQDNVHSSSGVELIHTYTIGGDDE